MRLFLVTSLLFLTAACTRAAAPVPSESPSAGHHAHASQGDATAELVPAGEAKPGDRTRCIVNGDVFVVEEDSPRVEHDGRTFYLCCEGCVDDFKANPAKYLEAAGVP